MKPHHYDPRIAVLRQQIEESASLVERSTELAMSILGDSNGLRLEIHSLRLRLVKALTECQSAMEHLESSREQCEKLAQELKKLQEGEIT